MTLKLRDWIPFDKIDWGALSYNPNAIHILEKNLDKVHWGQLSMNPSIFEYDYKAMTERPFVEELMQHLYHPDRLVRQIDVFGYDIGDDEYI